MPASQRIRVHEIYDCIQGESTLAGMPCTLLRLAGCPLDCSYCDTPEAIPFDSGTWIQLTDIVDDIIGRNRPLVLVSGGEPLAQKACRPLLDELAKHCPLLQLETSGAFDITNIHPAVRRILDIKTPDSGESERNLWANIEQLKAGDEIKFVLCSKHDYQWALQMLEKHFSHISSHIPILFSPVESHLPASELAAWILQDSPPVRMQLQMHKHIWGSEATGV
ncbi:MAG: 4Fe-4S cluster-binding domain-containing protein [Mariprofundaceae bacterium]